MNKRISDLDLLPLEKLHEDILLVCVDTDDHTTYSVRLGDIRKYYKYGPQYRARKSSNFNDETVVWLTPKKESLWKRFKRLFDL